VVGASDAHASEVKDRPVYPWDLVGSMYELLGIDPDGNVQHPQGMDVALLPKASDGVEVGTVLAIYRVVAPIPDPRPVIRPPYEPRVFQPERWLNVPDERSGLLFVFRVFDRVSYALLLNTTDPVVVGNIVRNP